MRALVLSGGGSHGSFQVGALDHLINNQNLTYDIISGISVGSLNGSFLAMYPTSKEKQGLLDLKNFWLNLENNSIYKNWFPFGPLHALWKNSAYNSQPLIDLVHKTIDVNKVKSSGKKISIGAVSLESGQYNTFTQDDDNFADAVLASSAFPGALIPIKIDGELWIDGGVRHESPIKRAIDLGATEIDAIICTPTNTTLPYDDKANTITLAIRTINLMIDQLTESDLKIAELYNQLISAGKCTNKKIIKINLIRPNRDLKNNFLDFNKDSVLESMSIGYHAAKQVIF